MKKSIEEKSRMSEWQELEPDMRLLFSCAQCEQQSGPSSHAGHAGMSSLKQHYRRVHKGEPVRPGALQIEPKTLFGCRGCKKPFSSKRSYSNHQRGAHGPACEQGGYVEFDNPHKDDPARNVPPPLVRKRPNPPKNPVSAVSAEYAKGFETFNELVELSAQRTAKKTPPPAANGSAETDASADDASVAAPDASAVTDAGADATLEKVEWLPPAVASKPCTDNSAEKSPLDDSSTMPEFDAAPFYLPASKAPPMVAEIFAQAPSHTLEQVLARYIRDAAELKRRLAIYDSLGIQTVAQVRRMLHAMPYAFRLYIGANGTHASDIGQLLFMIADFSVSGPE